MRRKRSAANQELFIGLSYYPIPTPIKLPTDRKTPLQRRGVSIGKEH